jgi:hypothetical protein
LFICFFFFFFFLKETMATLFPVVLEVEKLKIRDCFLWPSAGSSTPQEFAAAIAPDYGINVSEQETLAQIALALENQINRWQGVWQGTLQRWAQHGRKPFLHLFELEVDLDECVLRDRFHWDVNHAANSPEEFAEELVCDLGLKRTHEVLIAHAIRSQLFLVWEKLLAATKSEEEDQLATVDGFIRSDPSCQWAPQLAVKAKTGETPRSMDRYEQRARKSLKENLDDDLEDEDEEDEEDNDDEGEDEDDEDEDEEPAVGDEDEAKGESGSFEEE